MLPRHLPRIEIDVVDEQRYDTAGDYYATGSGWRFAISKQGSIDDEFLILVHELMEWYLTQKHGVPEPEITYSVIETTFHVMLVIETVTDGGPFNPSGRSREPSNFIPVIHFARP